MSDRSGLTDPEKPESREEVWVPESYPLALRWPLALLVSASIFFYIVLNWPAVAGPLRALWQAWSG